MRGGSERCVSFHTSLWLWLSRVISNLNLSFLCKIPISFSACYSLIIRRCLDEYAKRRQNVSLIYNCANILAHLIDFLNIDNARWTPRKIRKISIVCIRVAYSRNKLWLHQYIGADMFFLPLLLVLEKEKHCKKFTMLCLFFHTSPIS